MLIKRGTATIAQVFEDKKDISEEFDKDNIKVAESKFNEDNSEKQPFTKSGDIN